MFPYSFGYALQEYVVKIEFGPVGNPIWRQIWRQVPKNREFFFSIMFFRAKRLVGLDSNYDQRGSEEVNCNKKFVSPISNFGKHTISAKLCTQKLLGSLILNFTWKFWNAEWRTYFGNLMIFVELCTPGLLGSLITNFASDFQFSKWRIQYGGHEILETLRFSHNSVLGGFRSRWLRISNQYQILNQGPRKPWSTKFHENRWVSKILCPPFWIPKIRCKIHNQRPQKLLNAEFRGNRVFSKIAYPTYWISSILQRVWLFEIGETSCFLQFTYTVDHS